MSCLHAVEPKCYRTVVTNHATNRPRFIHSALGQQLQERNNGI